MNTFFYGMAKQTSKSTSNKTPAKTARGIVISFRITSDQENKLEEIQKRTPAMGIHSSRQLCRKIVSDYLAGRLNYKDPKHKERDLDKHPVKQAA